MLLVLEHADVVSSVAFSPDSRFIATSTGEWSSADRKLGKVKVWDAAAGEELHTLSHADAVRCVSFSPDGTRILTGGGDRTAILWDAATGRRLLTFTGHTAQVFSAAFSPDGLRIVTSSEDRTARVWDAATGAELLTLGSTRLRSAASRSARTASGS